LKFNDIKLTTIRDLKEYKPKSKYFVGLDSDGTIFDSMELKHKDCFIGSLIRVFGLASITHEIHEVWNFVNIYSNTRGTNRFKALVHTFNHLKTFDRVKSLKIDIPELNDLNNWIKSEQTLSNKNLIEFMKGISGKRKMALKNVIKWSKEVNQIVKSTVINLPPMDGALKALEKLKYKADLMVISNTPFNTLIREWSENSIYSNIEYIGGQETGTKTEMLKAVAKNNYPKKNILIIGDSPGDLSAAQNINALFFPILSQREEESWEVFNQIGFEHFFNGTYFGEFQNSQIKEFQSILKIKPHWLD